MFALAAEILFFSKYGMVYGASNVNCKAIEDNGSNVEWVTNENTLVM